MQKYAKLCSVANGGCRMILWREFMRETAGVVEREYDFVTTSVMCE